MSHLVPSSFHKKLILVGFALSGMTALIYEMVWIRPLSLIFGTTVYATSIIVASFLLGLAAGSFLAGNFLVKNNKALQYFAIIELGIGAYGILLLSVFSVLPGIYLDIYAFTSPNVSLFYFLQFFLAFSLILFPTTLMGATLPLVVKSFSNQFSSVGQDIGKLYSINNLGAVAGTILAGFLMIPFLGVETSILSAGILNIANGIMLFLISRSKMRMQSILAAIAVAVVFILLTQAMLNYDIRWLNYAVYLTPYYKPHDVRTFQELQDIKFYKESLYSTVTVSSIDGDNILMINGRTQCSTLISEIAGQERLASVPFELYSSNYNSPPNKALNIGLGCGITSAWLASRMDTTTIEIDPVVEEASRYFRDHIPHQLVIDDARNWLERNQDRRFDLIVAQPNDPFAGQWYLFTQEYISLLNSRLSENGIVSLWLPGYTMNMEDFFVMYNTFHSVFPYVYLYQERVEDNEIILIGTQKPLQPVGLLYISSHDEIQTSSTELNTDDKPIFEFSTAKNLYSDPGDNNSSLIETLVRWIEENRTADR